MTSWLAALARHRRQNILLLGAAEPDTTPSAAQSTFTADDYDITANSSSTATFAPIVRNAAGQLLADKTVVLARETIAVSAGNSLVAANPGTIEDDGVDACTITVTLKDASGRPIPDIPASDIVLAVSGANNTLTQPAAATNALGITTCLFVSTGAATKTVTITARGTLITQTQSVVVTGPPLSGFTNEPGGYTIIAEWNNESALVAEGFTIDGVTTWGNKTRVTSGYASAPAIGGAAVMQTFMAGGTEGGHDPQRHEYHGLSGVADAGLFMGAEAQWASNYPFSNNPGGGKQYIIWFTGGGRYLIQCDGSTNVWNIYENSSLLYSSSPGTGAMVRGSFRTMECEIIPDSGSGTDGVLRLWIDGTLAINETAVNTPAGVFDYFVTDHSNNGNRIPPSVSPDPRYINDTVTDVDAYVWTAAVHLSAA